MKKLGKISINPEKVIKNEELINLKGGYELNPCATKCITPNGYMIVYTETCSESDMNDACRLVYGWTGEAICVGCE